MQGNRRRQETGASASDGIGLFIRTQPGKDSLLLNTSTRDIIGHWAKHSCEEETGLRYFFCSRD